MEEKIHRDLKQAQLNRDEVKVSTLRLLLSEIKNTQIAKSSQLTDQDVVGVIQKEVKKRKEAAQGFLGGGRQDSALKEESEANILEGYLPHQLSDEELTKIVADTINEVGATSIAEMGRVIGIVMRKVSGQADGGRVSQMARQKLTS